MPKYSNTQQIPLSLAVWLATDTYDRSDDPNTISATTLLKPIRQIVLARRVPTEDAHIDLVGMLASRMGTAIHDAIERAWTDAQRRFAALEAIGYPSQTIQRMVINPEPGTDLTGLLPIYLENRSKRVLNGMTISGKYDMVIDGAVEDFKTTSVWEWIKHNNGDDYTMQGSIYRWLNPEIITKDVMSIQLIFTDWSSAASKANADYPPKRTMERKYQLKSIPETEAFIVKKLNQIAMYLDAPEEEIPLCTEEELWATEPVFKYYKNPEKTTRSTKNFDTHQEAMLRYVEDGSVGLIKETPGYVKACLYCPAYLACGQKDQLIESGRLQLTNI